VVCLPFACLFAAHCCSGVLLTNPILNRIRLDYSSFLQVFPIKRRSICDARALLRCVVCSHGDAVPVPVERSFRFGVADVKLVAREFHGIVARNGCTDGRMRVMDVSEAAQVPLAMRRNDFRIVVCPPTGIDSLAQPKIFSAWLRQLFRHDWVVYCKPPFGGPEHALRYLGAYTHRVAISNHRPISLADGQVTFRWRDSAHKNQKRLVTLSLDEFLRRFLLHLFARGFVRIRNFGFLANRRRALSLPLCTHLLGSAHQPTPVPSLAPRPVRALTSWTCPMCGGPMHVIERLTAAQIQLRDSPFPREYAA